MYAVVHEFRGGAKKLAALVGMNAGTLSNKVNPAMEGHHLTVKESVTLQHTTRDFRILYAIAAALDHSCIPFGNFSRVSDVELLNAYARWHAEQGETAQAISDALADGRITRQEYGRVRREIHEDIQRAFEFLARMEAVIDGE